MSERKAPARFKPRGEWSVHETVEFQRTGRKPETDEYKAYVREVHEEAGLEPPASEPKPIEEMSIEELEALTPEDHFNRIQGQRS